jgi:hypothetical protein
MENYPWDVVSDKYEKQSKKMLDEVFIIIVHQGNTTNIQHCNIKGQI